MKIIYHSHSFIEIVLEKGSILIDPFIKDNPTIKTSIDDICKRNIISAIVTHGHHDHIGDAEHICKETGCILISTFEISNYFGQEKGVENVHAMHIGGEYNFGDYSVKLTSAVHGGGVADMKSGYTTFPAGVVVRADGHNIYHAGDTGLTYDMKLLGDYDDIDIAFLPIGGNFTMGIDDAVIAARDFIKPKKVIPIHYNTWGIIEANPKEFVEKMKQNGLNAEEVEFGGEVTL